MPFAREHARPLLGSVVLHAALLGLLVSAAVIWRPAPEPVTLAIEGTVVSVQDLPPSLRGARPRPQPPPPVIEPTPPPEPTVDPRPAEAVQAEAAARAADEARRQREAEAAEQRRAADERRIEEARAREVAAAEKRKADAAAKARTEADARRKADEEARRKAQAEAAERKAAQEQAARDAKLRSAREAELQRALAAEEEGEAFDRSGVVDEYRALLVQTIERNWKRPPSARAGLECTLNVTQATGGTVLDVRVGACNGDQAVRESITNAVYNSSPLPAPRDPRAFQRQLVIVFKPTE